VTRRREQASSKGAARTGSLSRSVLPPTAIETIVYDVSTGIRTRVMKDGSVTEESFDRADLPAIRAEQAGRETRITIVNEQAPMTMEGPSDEQKKPPNAAPIPVPAR
jgi:hypothetical protein